MKTEGAQRRAIPNTRVNPHRLQARRAHADARCHSGTRGHAAGKGYSLSFRAVFGGFAHPTTSIQCCVVSCRQDAYVSKMFGLSCLHVNVLTTKLRHRSSPQPALDFRMPS